MASDAADRRREWSDRVRAEAQKKTRRDARPTAQVRTTGQHTGGIVKSPISQAGDRTSGVLACPKCGGAQFKAKRRGKHKAMAWVAAPISLGLSAVVVAAAPKSRVQCVTCKTEYLRV